MSDDASGAMNTRETTPTDRYVEGYGDGFMEGLTRTSTELARTNTALADELIHHGHEITRLESENAKLVRDNNSLKRQVSELRAVNSHWRAEVLDLEERNSAQAETIRNYMRVENRTRTNAMEDTK